MDAGFRIAGEAGTAAGATVLVRSRRADVLVIGQCTGNVVARDIGEADAPRHDRRYVPGRWHVQVRE
jgi:hypothetical protein